MRMTRSLLLTGTILPALILGAPVLADTMARPSSEGAAPRMELAQLGEEGPAGRGGGGAGPRGGGAERGGGGERGGGPPAARERPEAPAARERPEPRQAPAARERPEAPAARERPEPKPAPAARERPEPAAPPAARERPEPRQAPAARERPEPATPPAARERPAAPQAPATREAPERATPPATRPTPPATPPREDRTPPAPQQRQAPTAPTRPTPPTSDEPTRTAPAQRRAPDAPTPPTATPPTATPPARPADPQAPTAPGAPQQRQQPARTPPGTAPGQQPTTTAPGGSPDTAPGAAPPAPNQRPGVPGRPFTPPGQQPNAVQPGQQPGQPGTPGAQPGAQPGVVQPGQQPGQVPPGQQPSQLQQNQLQPGQQPGGVGRDGDRRGPGFDNDRRDGYGRNDDDRRGPGARDSFNTPGRPGYIPGGFRDSREDDDIRDYDRIRRDRREYEVDGRNYYREPGRIIVRDRDNYYIRHDENERFRDLDRRGYRSERRGQETFSYIDRPGGEQIVTVVDDDGRLVRRYRRFRDGREVIIINNGYGPGGPRPIYDDVVDLPPPDIRIPRDRYVVDYERADRRAVYGALTAPPVVAIDRRYSLDQVRYSPQLRARMPSVDINTITFDSGSFTVTPEQARQLQNIADAINEAVKANPQEVFLIEGYTDAVGTDIDNLSLSDRRAQSVATVLTQTFQVPPENLTTQGYGEQYLKVNTQEANRENRRVTVRRITPLLQQQADQQAPPPPAPPR